MEFEVKNMSCGHCASVISQTVKLVDPDAKVAVDIAGKKITIDSEEDRGKFASALTDTGYPTA